LHRRYHIAFESGLDRKRRLLDIGGKALTLD